MIETTARRSSAFSSIFDHLFVIEGQLREHVFEAGRYESLLIAALWRESWNVSSLRERVLRGTRSVSDLDGTGGDPGAVHSGPPPPRADLLGR